MMYQDNYARQEVYCQTRTNENDYCTYMDPDMLLATCAPSFAVENEEPQWYNSALSSPIDVQLHYADNMPLPPSPADSLTFSPYSETISQQPSPIESAFDYYSPPVRDSATPYDYFYYSQPSPLMDNHHYHRQHSHHDNDGAMYPSQQPVYPPIIARQGPQQNLDNNTTASPAPSSALVTVGPPPPSLAAVTKATTTTTTTVAAAKSNTNTGGDTMAAAAASANASSTAVRPYPCYLCSRAFARKHDLQRHIRVHTGAKPYACLCCKKAFARTDALKRHLRMEEACRTSPEIQAMKCAGKRRYRNL